VGGRPGRRFVARVGGLVGQRRARRDLCRRCHRCNCDIYADGHVCFHRAGAPCRHGDSPAAADRQPYPVAYQYLDAYLGADRYAHGDVDADADLDAYTASVADFHA
jgi:hypothetical protein